MPKDVSTDNPLTIPGTPSLEEVLAVKLSLSRIRAIPALLVVLAVYLWYKF